MNSIVAIHPYKFEGLWVFDDSAVVLSSKNHLCLVQTQLLIAP